MEEFSEPLIGFRVWRWENELLMPSAWAKFAWRAGVNRAVCAADRSILSMTGRPPHGPCPEIRCQCGFYSYDSLETARYHLKHGVIATKDRIYVMGAVAIWGRVLVGTVKQNLSWQEKGAELERPGLRFRSQYAQVIALTDQPNPKAAEGAAKKFAVELVATSGLEVYAREYGRQMRAA